MFQNYYKLWQNIIITKRQNLLQIVTDITKSDMIRDYYKVWRLLLSVIIIIEWDVTPFCKT